ncbi:hypothetical protein HDR63_00865 [bacterium]|nr:hypothetical protein [bacterium]
MNLRYVTCSDPREDTAISDALAFLRRYPMAELAVQAHPSKMSVGMDRRVWFEKLLDAAAGTYRTPHLTVHVNRDWCHAFCAGNLVPDLQDWLQRTHKNGDPLVRRVQINVAGNDVPDFRPLAVAEIIQNFPAHEFIFQYTSPQGARIRRLADTGARFSVLYDASGGAGRTPRQTGRPFSFALATGYSGGIGPENVTDRLMKIAAKADEAPVWIDAEGKLKNPDTNRFDLKLAQAYVSRAIYWLRDYSK